MSGERSNYHLASFKGNYLEALSLASFGLSHQSMQSGNMGSNFKVMKSSFSTFCSSILYLLHACKRRARSRLSLILSHAFVDTAVIKNFISYIIDEWMHKSLPVAAAIVNVQEGISTIFRLIVVHIADAYVGRFKIVACTTSLYILGLVLLIFVHQSGSFGLFASLLITVGIAGPDPTLKAFLSDHVIKPTEANINNVVNEEKLEACTNLWWRVAWSLGAAISVIILSLYNLNYKIVFIVSAGLMGVAYVLFWSGIFFYHPCRPTGSPLSIVYRVVTVAMLKRHLSYPTDSNEVLLFPHNPLFRFLDKAAIPETSNPDQERQQGRLCTKEEVNRMKKLLALLPMWTSLLVYALAKATGSTFFIEQSDGFDPIEFFGLTLPINAFSTLASLVSFIVSYLFSALIPKRWKENKEKHELVTLWRFGLGMVYSILCCVTASKVDEVRRWNYIHKKIKMSMLWLFPQFTLLGVEGTEA
ncbi:protein NRT1/ PTR FAMILY 5.6-like [Hevea brasiliensis]|uniref:protein NRT1/ PTR FAMILY 5.6-like n=1 Tax=Hevea brasiliensis TaxID=3981 RepID=UPI0025F9AB91|nr:protein NRT1/ PTR FAMILY 5.6-like [Hevea brasiliensis]